VAPHISITREESPVVMAIADFWHQAMKTEILEGNAIAKVVVSNHNKQILDNVLCSDFVSKLGVWRVSTTGYGLLAPSMKIKST